MGPGRSRELRAEEERMHGRKEREHEAEMDRAFQIVVEHL